MRAQLVRSDLRSYPLRLAVESSHKNRRLTVAARLLATAATALAAHHNLDLAVQHQHERAADRAERVRPGALEHGRGALVLQDLAEAVQGALVEPLGLRLLGLHLEAATHRVERVRSVRSRESRRLRARELRGQAQDAALLLVRVDAIERVVDAEVGATERDDADHRDREPVVEAHDASRARGRLLDAVEETVELLLATAHIRRETRPRIVERVDDAQRARTSETTGGHVDREELGELLLRVSLREQPLDGVLEREVEGLRREVADAVGQVATPERSETLLLVDPREAVPDAGVARHLPGHDLRIGILGLDDELHTLDRCRAALGDAPRRAASNEVLDEIKGHRASIAIRTLEPK